MRPTVTAVIPHYFEARAEALNEAVRALVAGSVPPDEILIWDNIDRFRLQGAQAVEYIRGSGQVLRPQVRILSGGKNLGPKARFLAALTAETDYVFFQDNDMVVERETIANLLSWMTDPDQVPDSEGGVLTLEGRLVSLVRPYRHWPKVHGHGLRLPQRVAISLGRAELVPHGLLPKILAHFPWSPTTIFDDLWFSACARAAEVSITVIPSIKGVSDLRDLHTGVGLCTEPGYYDRRDALAQQLFCGGPHA